MDEKDIDKALKYKQDLQKLAMSPVKAADYVSPLEAKNLLAKGQAMLPEAKQVIKGVTDSIDTKGVQKLLSGSQFQDKLASILKSRAASKALGVANTGLKSVPILGTALGIGSALMAGDASAAVPVLDEADPIGPERGTPEYNMENGTASPEELELLRNRVQ